MITTLALVAVLTTLLVTMTVVDVSADNSKGNHGKCKKLQKTLPEELQDFEGCKDTFTGKDHNDPDPLP